MPLALWALALGAFGIGTTEFVVAGILQDVARDFGISVPLAGYMATSYALGVFIGAPLVTILGGGIARKHLLIILAGLFIVGNVVTALAPTIEIALLGRVITALNHGTFFGMGAILAAEMVAADKRAQAIAFMFSGLTIANLVGVPLGTWLAQAVSWRAPFYAVSLIGVATMVGITAFIPFRSADKTVRLYREFKAFVNPHVLLAMGITVLGPAAFFTSITYITPMMTQVAGMPENSMVWFMVLFGLGLVIGNILGGRYADRSLMMTLYVTLIAQAAVLLVFWLFAASPWVAGVCIFLMAGFGFATVAPIQKLVMDKASAAGAPTLASAVNIGMFNLGNALGAWLGGLVITLNFGFAAPNWAGAALSVGALLLAIWVGCLDRRT